MTGKIVVEKYHPKHLELIDAKSLHSGEIPKEIHGDAVTFVRGGMVLAIFGGFYVSEHVFNLWAIVAKDAEIYWISFARKCIRHLRFVMKAASLQRVQIALRESECATLQRWAKFLGFEQEGLMRAYGPNRENYWLYARTQWQQ